MNRTSFSRFDLAQALQKVGLARLSEWKPEFVSQPLSTYFEENMRRLRRFDTARSEGAKLLLADAFFEEAIQPYTRLRIFKETTIQGTDTGGLVDYLVAPDGAVPVTPFLCVSEAKKDDFDKGLAQCLVELYACGEINAAAGNEITVFGIVTNGASWQFYRREVGGEVFETSTFSIARPPDILGILDHVFAQCEQNLP